MRKQTNWQGVLLQLLGHAVSHIALLGFHCQSAVEFAGHNRPGHSLLSVLPQEQCHLLSMLEHCPHKQVVKSAYKVGARGRLRVLRCYCTFLQTHSCNTGCFNKMEWLWMYSYVYDFLLHLWTAWRSSKDLVSVWLSGSAEMRARWSSFWSWSCFLGLAKRAGCLLFYNKTTL